MLYPAELRLHWGRLYADIATSASGLLGFSGRNQVFGNGGGIGDPGFLRLCHRYQIIAQLLKLHPAFKPGFGVAGSCGGVRLSSNILPLAPLRAAVFPETSIRFFKNPLKKYNRYRL